MGNLLSKGKSTSTSASADIMDVMVQKGTILMEKTADAAITVSNKVSDASSTSGASIDSAKLVESVQKWSSLAADFAAKVGCEVHWGTLFGCVVAGGLVGGLLLSAPMLTRWLRTKDYSDRFKTVFDSQRMDPTARNLLRFCQLWDDDKGKSVAMENDALQREVEELKAKQSTQKTAVEVLTNKLSAQQMDHRRVLEECQDKVLPKFVDNQKKLDQNVRAISDQVKKLEQQLLAGSPMSRTTIPSTVSGSTEVSVPPTINGGAGGTKQDAVPSKTNPDTSNTTLTALETIALPEALDPSLVTEGVRVGADPGRKIQDRVSYMKSAAEEAIARYEALARNDDLRASRTRLSFTQVLLTSLGGLFACAPGALQKSGFVSSIIPVRMTTTTFFVVSLTPVVACYISRWMDVSAASGIASVYKYSRWAAAWKCMRPPAYCHASSPLCQALCLCVDDV